MILSAAALAASAAALAAPASANTELDVSNGQTDLINVAYVGGGTPTPASDVTFNGTYSSTTFDRIPSRTGQKILPSSSEPISRCTLACRSVALVVRVSVVVAATPVRSLKRF